MPEPGKFFIGITDFFAVLLPGAMLTFFLWPLRGAVMPQDFVVLFSHYSEVAFAVCSYILGHFIFLCGSWMDHILYDKIRDAVGSDRRSAARFFARLLMPRATNNAVRQATILKKATIKDEASDQAINTFQWAKALLALEHPEALAMVQKFEADSKFFRSFVVVLLIVLLVTTVSNVIGFPPIGVTVVFALLLLSFWRYVDQRLKATNQAYWYALLVAGSASSNSDPRSQKVTA